MRTTREIYDDLRTHLMILSNNVRIYGTANWSRTNELLDEMEKTLHEWKCRGHEGVTIVDIPANEWISVKQYLAPTPGFENESETRITIEERWLPKGAKETSTE